MNVKTAGNLNTVFIFVYRIYKKKKKLLLLMHAKLFPRPSHLRDGVENKWRFVLEMYELWGGWGVLGSPGPGLPLLWALPRGPGRSGNRFLTRIYFGAAEVVQYPASAWIFPRGASRYRGGIQTAFPPPSFPAFCFAAFQPPPAGLPCPSRVPGPRPRRGLGARGWGESGQQRGLSPPSRLQTRSRGVGQRSFPGAVPFANERGAPAGGGGRGGPLRLPGTEARDTPAGRPGSEAAAFR